MLQPKPKHDVEALKMAYEDAKKQGYSKDINSFHNLLKTDKEALSMAYDDAKKQGYGKSIDDFQSLFGVEKKNSNQTTQTSTSPNQKLASVQKVGSSDIQKSQNKTLPVDEFGVTNFNQPRTQPKVETAPITEKQPLVQTDSLGTTDFGKTPFTKETDLNVENFDKAKSIRKDYSNAIYIPEEKNAEFEQEYNAKVNNEGFVNKAKTAVKNWWNNVIDVEPALQVSTDHLVEEKKQAKDELKKELNGKEPTPEQLQKRTKEIFVAKKKGDYQQSLSDSYLESLSDEDRQLVEVKLAKELPTLDKDYVNKTNSFILLGKDIDAIDKELAQMKRIVKEQSEMGNNNLDPKFYEEARRLEDLRRNKIIVAKSMDDELYKSKAKLGSALEEYDNFKRSYGDFDVLANRLKSGIADIGYGLSSFKNYVNRADRYFGTEIEGITPEIAEIEKSEKEVDFAKKVIDKEQEFFRKRVKEVNGIGDFINYTTDVVGDQIPNMLPFMLTGGLGGGAVIFGSSTGNQYAEMIDGEINQTPFSRIYTDEEKVVAPFVFGVSDAALSAIPTWGRMLRGKRTIQSALKEKGGVDLFAKSSLETAKKGLLRIGKDNASEQLEEQGANLIQNFTKVVYLKQEGATMLDGVEDVFKDTTTFSTLLSAFPVAMGGVIKSVSSADQISKFDENAKQIIALKQRLSNSDLSVSQKSIIQSQIDKKTVESKKMISDIQKKFKNKGTEILESVNDVNRSINETLTKAKEIQDSNLPKSEKEVILDGLKQDYSAGIDKREKLLSDKSTILDTLSDSEQIKLKDKAQRELVKQAKESGKETFEFDDEQITKKAVELYEESKPKAVVEQEPETQPQAKKQAEVVEVETPQAGSVGVGGDVEIKNEGKADAPTKESVTERLSINNPFYKKVEDALVKLGLIEKYNAETGTGDVVGGYAQQTSDGGFSVGKMLFSQDGSISYFDGDVKVSFDKNGNVISENTKEAKQKANVLAIESKKESIDNLEKTRDSEAFKYKEVTETDTLGNKKKVKRLKTEQELKDSTDKINAAIDKAKAELSNLEQSLKETPQAKTNEATPSNNNQINEVNENAVVEENVEVLPDSNQIKKPTIVVHGAVNGFGLQYAEGVDEKDVVSPKDGRGFLPQEQQKLLNEYKSVVEKDAILEDGSKSISIITPSADNFGRSATNTFEFVIPKGNKSTTEGIKSILDNITKSDLKGKEVINESVKQVKEYINKNEATPTNNNQINEVNENAVVEENVEVIPDSNQIKNEEYSDFIDKGIVSEERLISIANKVKNQEKLSEKETAIFNDKTSEINEILRNEATPTNITPTDGNIQPGVGNMAEVGVEEQPTAEVIAEEDIQPSNDVGAVEVKNKVEDIDINDIENFLNEMYSKNNQNENNKPTADKGNERADSNSAEQNIGEPKSEEKAKKISLKGRTPIAKRKFKGDRAKANAVEPSDVYSLVLNYFVSGGKIGSASVKELLKSDSEVKARNNGFNGISKKSAKETDALAHDLWQLALSLGIQTDTQLVKEAIEDIVGSHNTNQDITNTILKRNNLELSEEDKVKKLEDFYIAQAVFDQVQEQNDASDEEMQEAQGALDMLSDAEIIELANNQSKSYDDYLKDLEERRVTFNIGPFEEVGTVQSDGSIINDEGEIFSKESVSNVKQVNPKPKKEKVTKVPTGVTGKGTKNISASAKSLLKEIDKKIEDARQKVRTAKEALDRKAKSLDKEMAKDQENLFGERKSSAEAKLFDERVNAQARNKATESERNAIKTAQDELRKLIQTKKDVESGKVTSNQVDLEDVAAEENKQSEYKFSDSPSLKNTQAVDSSILPITPKATENILKNEGNWGKAIIGDVKNLGNGWFEVGKTAKGESILYSPTTDKAVTIVDSENKGGRNAIYVNDFINNNPTISEKQQRKEKLNAEVDKIADKIKEILPGINDPDLNKQGFSQDQLIDLIANAVKNLIAAGIDINEAIKQVVESIKDKFGVDVNPDDVKAKLKSERNKNFKKKSGKKSVLGRAVSGGEPLNITEEIEKYGLDYEVESQAKAQENAKEFVKAVGRENALIAVRSGQIKGAEKAFVYAEIIDGIVKEMDSVTIETPDRIALNAQHSIIMGEIMNEFDIQGREAGRFISALNRVYFSTYFKYNLSRQINLYKARNGGEISPEKLQEYKETDAKLKELERKIEEAEKRAEEAEAKLAMENIVEEVERTSKKQKPDSNAKKAKILAEKIRRGKINRPGIFMSATPASLVWDGAIEIVAKAVEAEEILSNAIKKGMDYIKKSSWYQSLSDSDKNEAEKSFEDHVRKDARPAMVYIDEDGNIKVPESLIRSLVEQGVKDIDELSQKVLDTIIDEYPDLTLRQVRDAITKYGKTINPDPDTISTEIRKLKRLGKLISGLEDAKSGKRPLKSGLQRDEITQLERKLKRELKDLLRDLPLDDDSVKKTWKTALDAIKSRLRNQIEDLEKQIANKEKSKPEKTPVEYDEEAKALKQKRDELKDTLESIVGKPELSEEKKIIKAIAMLEKSIQNLNEQIADNNIAYKIKPTPVTSARIEELKKQKAELVEQIKQMRIDSGIAEARRLQSAKSRIKNRIAELEKRIKEKNYTTKKPTPLKADQELLDLQAEKIRTQEVYDKDKYIDELKNRTDRQKAIDAALGFWGIPRVVMATGEASWIFIQGGIQTVNRTLKNPVQMFKIFKKMFKAMASDSKAKEYESLTKVRKDYPIMKQAKLALTEVDHKLEAKEEQFLGDYANTVWDFIGVGLRKLSKNKEYRSPFSYFRQLLGKQLNSADKATLEQYWKNINPLRILERGNTVYMNELRMARFEEGIEMLQSELKDPIEDIEDYKMLASAINTMTGRANIDSLQANSKILAAIFFSFRNAVSVFNQLNPIFYLYQLHNPKDPITKVSVAQKIAVADMMRFVTFTTGMMLLLQAAMGDDEEGNPKMTIETDPRSSDFGKMKMGDLRIDPWHGMMPMIVLISRMSTDESKNVNTGVVTAGGTKFGTRTRNELVVDFITNKFNPSMGILWGYGSSHKVMENGVEIRKDMFGNEINVLDEVANLQPMYWDAVSEIKKEQPGLWGDFFVAAGALGINSQVYDKPKPKVSSGFNRPRRPSFERPKRP